ncbi:MAG: SpoIIE family protein phosphatase [Candidatus Ancaeobacter aquaticus]|nr:SpoIIE family protein phosphatase [Candidatus Ancaeobacter aquaticus]
MNRYPARHNIITKTISLVVCVSFIFTNIVLAAPQNSSSKSCLAPQSEGQQNGFNDILAQVKAKWKKKVKAKKIPQDPLAVPNPDSISEMMPDPIKFIMVYLEQDAIRRALEILSNAKKMVQPDPAENVELYKDLCALEDDILKTLLVKNMAPEFFKEFQRFAKKSVSEMSFKEMRERVTAFNGIIMNQYNRIHTKAVNEDPRGIFSLNYIHDLFYDPLMDDDDIQRDIFEKYGVVVGGDAVIILRDTNGDVYIFEIDATGHGAEAARLLDPVIPYIYSSWEERVEGAEFINDELFINFKKMYDEFETLRDNCVFLTMNAVHIRAEDGKVSQYNFGADPALLISTKGDVNKFTSEGMPLGVSFDKNVVQRLNMSMRPGERMLVYSDGITEAQTSEIGVYGDSRFKEFITGHISLLQGLPIEKAVDEILKKIISVTTLSKEEEKTYRKYIKERYEDLQFYDKRLQNLIANQPKGTSSDFNKSIMSDMIEWTEVEGEAKEWDDYIVNNFDQLLDGLYEFGAMIDKKRDLVGKDAFDSLLNDDEIFNGFLDECRKEHKELYEKYDFDQFKNYPSIVIAISDEKTADPKVLYELILRNFKRVKNIKKLCNNSYAGNSGELFILIKKHADMSLAELIKLLKDTHHEFSNKPVSATQTVNDDISLISIQYLKKPKKHKVAKQDVIIGTVDISFTDKMSPPVITGTVHVNIIENAINPCIKQNAVMRTNLLHIGDAKIEIFDGKRLSYVKDGKIFINNTLFMSKEQIDQLNELREKSDTAKIDKQEVRELTSLEKRYDRMTCMLHFVLISNVYMIAHPDMKLRDVYNLAVKYYQTLSRTEQNAIVNGLMPYKKYDVNAEGYQNLFRIVQKRGVNTETKRERFKIASYVAIKQNLERMQILNRDAAKGNAVWSEINQALSKISGIKLIDYDLESDGQKIVAMLWNLITDSDISVDEEIKKDISTSLKRIMSDLVTRKQEIRKLYIQKYELLKDLEEVSPESISYFRDFFFPGLINGDMKVKGLVFKKDISQICIKKGKHEFGTVPLKNMRVYKKGTKEYILINIEKQDPIILEVDVVLRKLKIVKYKGDTALVLLFPEKAIDIKRARLTTSGIKLSRLRPNDPVYFVADGVLNKDGKLVIDKIYPGKDIPRVVPDLADKNRVAKINEVMSRALEHYPLGEDINIKFVCGNDRAACSVIRQGGNNVIVIDIEDIRLPNLLYMDIEEELLHMKLAKMPYNYQPPLAIEEIMAALLKVYRFKSLSPASQKKILDVSKDEKNDLDDQEFYKILSLPLTTSLDTVLDEIIKYVRRPGVFSPEISEYLEVRSIDDIKDELYGRIPTKDGRRTDWFALVYEEYPQEVLNPAVVPAVVLPVDEVIGKIYKTDHEKMLKHIYGKPQSLLGIENPYERYMDIQKRYKDILFHMDHAIRVRETVALMVLEQRLSSDALRNRFEQMYRNTSSSIIAYKALIEEYEGLKRVSEKTKVDVIASLLRVMNDIKDWNSSLNQDLKELKAALREAVTKEYMSQEALDKTLKKIETVWNNSFKGARENDDYKALAYYKFMSTTTDNPMIKYESYNKAREYFQNIVKSENIILPNVLTRLRPRLSVSLLNEDGVYEDKTIEDLIKSMYVDGNESPFLLSKLKMLLNYYGLDYVPGIFLSKINERSPPFLYVIGGIHKKGPKRMYFGEVSKGPLALSRETPKEFSEIYDGVIEPGKIIINNMQKIKTDPDAEKYFDIFLEFKQFNGYTLDDKVIDFYQGALVRERPAYIKQVPFVPVAVDVRPLVEKFREIFSRIGIYGKDADLEEAFAEKVKELVKDADSVNPQIDIDYTGLSEDDLTTWWSYIASKLEENIKNPGYDFEDVSIDDFYRHINVPIYKYEAPLAALPVLQHDINTEARYIMNKDGDIELDKEYYVSLGSFLPVYKNQVKIIKRYFKDFFDAGNIKAVRVVKRLREGKDVRITDGELIIPISIFCNEQHVRKWLDFVLARQEGLIGNEKIDDVLSGDYDVFVEYKVRLNKEGRFELKMDYKNQDRIGVFSSVFDERAKEITEFFNREGWPLGLQKVRIERQLKHGAHVDKPRGLMVFPLDMLKTREKFKVMGLPHERDHFQIDEEREIEEVLNISRDILYRIMPLAETDKDSYRVFLDELESDEIRAQKAGRDYLPRLKNLIKKYRGTPQEFEYRYEKRMIERQLGKQVVPFYAFLENVINKTERMKQQGLKEEDIQKAVIKEVYGYVAMNEGVYPYESHMLKIRGSKNVVGAVFDALKKYPPPRTYVKSVTKEIVPVEDVKKISWQEYIPGMSFFKSRISRYLMIAALVVGFNMLMSTPAYAFDGKTVIAGAAEFGAIAGHLVIFYIIFTIIHALIPGGGLALSFILNLLIIFGYRQYSKWKQMKLEEEQYIQTAPVKKGVPIVKPEMPAWVAKKKKSNIVDNETFQKFLKIAEERKKQQVQPKKGSKGGEIIRFPVTKEEKPIVLDKEKTVPPKGLKMLSHSNKTLIILTNSKDKAISEAAREELKVRTPEDEDEREKIEKALKREVKPEKAEMTVLEEPSVWQRIYRSLSVLPRIFGFYWPLILGIKLLSVSPLDAAIIKPEGLYYDKTLTDYESAAIILTVAGIVAIITYMYKSIHKKSPPVDVAFMSVSDGAKSTIFDRNMSKFWKEFFKKPAGKKIQAKLMDKYYKKLNKIAVFNIVSTEEGLKPVLDDEFMGGKNEQSEKILKEKGITMQYVIDNIRDIVKMIEVEPAGDQVKKLVVIDEDNYYIHAIKNTQTIYLRIELFDKKALLKIHFIPHEVYHMVVEGEIATEEILVHALTFLRDVNNYKMGKMDPQAKQLFDQMTSELAQLEAPRMEKGRITQSSIISKLIFNVEEEERLQQREITSEEIFALALPLTLEYCRANEDLFMFRGIAHYISQRSDPKLLKEVDDMWMAQRDNMLRGNRLFSFLLPFAFLDFFNYSSDLIYIRALINLGIIGLVVTDLRLVYELKNYFNKITGRRVALMPPQPVLEPPLDKFEIILNSLNLVIGKLEDSNIPSPDNLFSDGVPYTSGYFINSNPSAKEIMEYEKRIKTMLREYPRAYLALLSIAGLMTERAIKQYGFSKTTDREVIDEIGAIQSQLNKRFVLSEILDSSGIKGVPEIYKGFIEEKNEILKGKVKDNIVRGLDILDGILIGAKKDVSAEQKDEALDAACAINFLNLLIAPSNIAKTADIIEPFCIYESMVSQEEGFSAFNARPDKVEGDLEVVVLHAESFYKMKYDRKIDKEVPVLKDLGSSLLLKSLMNGRLTGSTRRFVWVATTEAGHRIRKLAGLPDADLQVDPMNFEGELEKLETDTETARQFVAFVEQEIESGLKKGEDADKNLSITVITESRYYKNIWSEDIRDFLFAILSGEEAIPSTALVAVFGDKIPRELEGVVEETDTGIIIIAPKPEIRDINYLNEITRQSAELATSA